MRDRDRHVVALEGELDLANTAELAREFARVEASDAREILLDLQGLRFIDSIGMQAIIRISARLERNDRPFMIRPGPHNIQRCFELCGLTSRLPFVDAETLSARAF